MEVWQEINEFPCYSVSDLGRIRNNKRGRLVSLAQNQGGVVHVGLVKNGLQLRRSVALIVASTFLAAPINPSYNTPINLDGDRTNNEAANLMWRPRWFAVRYARQFENYPNLGLYREIEDEETGERFESSWSAAMANGVLERDVVISILSRSPLWPTYQRFSLVQN